MILITAAAAQCFLLKTKTQIKTEHISRFHHSRHTDGAENTSDHLKELGMISLAAFRDFTTPSSH